MTNREPEPPRLQPRDVPDVLRPEALEDEDEDEERPGHDRQHEQRPPSEPPA